MYARFFNAPDGSTPLSQLAKLDTNKIKIVINSKKHSFELANKIMNFVQKEFEEKMYITITFEDK